MIPVFIVLIVIAAALGGFIVFDVLHGKKKAAVTDKTADTDKIADTDKTAENAVADLSPKTKEIAAPAVSEAVITDTTETDDNSDEEDTKTVAVTENGQTRYIIIKYNKSFLAKLIQSDDETKSYYSRVKNCLLSYEGVKSRVSWKWESFRLGRKTLAKLQMRGKTLSLCLALNPEDYADTKYKVESLAEVKAYEDTPCMYRIKNDRRLKYSEDLIATLMAQNNLSGQSNAEIDYAKDYPYETTEVLIARKLIKELTDEEAQSGTAFRPSEVRESVTADEVDEIISDEVAVTLIVKEKREFHGKKVKDIVNLDDISKAFQSGDTVNLAALKEKGLLKRSVNYFKVLARGTLDKAITVEANDFSIEAVKMVVLTGGKAVKI